MMTSDVSNLFEHELSQSPDLLSVLGVIHNVVLHEKGLHRGKNAEHLLCMPWELKQRAFFFSPQQCYLNCSLPDTAN